ncbi:MAG: TerB family tellurite resistance protein [Muribaculaceae bacterium]|nr:TerB family tellurite resistance protein [Muribaculaceae bacterium]
MNEKLKSHFLSLYCMIVSDNEVSPSELEELYRIAHQFYGYSEEEINSTVLSQGTALYNPDTIEEKLQYLYELALIACADGIIKQEEIQLLKYYALEFGFKKENIDEIVEFLIANAKEKNEVNEVILKLYN